jgi:hypothetical protein
MGQHSSLELSKEELGNLAISLLREWWLVTTQALVDEVGSTAAMDLLTPAFEHHGRVALHKCPRRKPLPENNLMTIAIVEAWAKYSISGIPVHVEIRDNSITWTIEGCETSGQCKEVCLCLCDIGSKGLATESEQGLSYSLVQSLSKGDKLCRAVFRKSGNSVPSGPVVSTLDSQDLNMTREERDFWSRAILGENWAIVTRAMVERLGSDRTIATLRPYMRQTGLSLGMRMMSGLKADEGTSRLPLDLVTLVQASFGMQTIPEAFGRTGSGQVVSCPFSGSPPEMCHQFETCLNGICESINPAYKFAYDRMMTKGDKTCHWTIKKKIQPDETNKRGALKESGGSALELLKKRLVKGEITPDQYRELRDLLLEK